MPSKKGSATAAATTAVTASTRGRSGRQTGSSSNSTRPSTPPPAAHGGVRASGGSQRPRHQPPAVPQQQSGRSSRVSQVEDSHSVESHDSAEGGHENAMHAIASFKPIAGGDVDAFQMQLNTWFTTTARDLNAAYTDMVGQIGKFEEELRSRYGPRIGAPLPPPLRFGLSTPMGIPASARATGAPPPAPAIAAVNGSSFSITAGPGGKPEAPVMSYDALLEEVEAEQHQSQYSPSSGFAASGRFTTPLAPQSTTRLQQGAMAPSLLLGIGGSSNPSPMAQSAVGVASARDAATLGWHVLVEFKRSKVIYESEVYVPAGQFVVVGGDRGEDIGHVAHCWSGAHPEKAPPVSALAVAERSATGGLNRVQRIATAPEVAQLQGMQSELEARARDVAQQKVTEHGLPMRIVDAEYQFDRKKLTFYYQAHQRLDFRVLVRDLYKTFRARIWMELDPHFAQQHPLIGNLVAGGNGNGTPPTQDLFP